MSLWVLDTDHVSLLLERHPQVSRRVVEVGSEVAISIVTVQELFNGWVVRINAARDVEDIVRLYGKLSLTVTLFKRVRVLDFDQTAGKMFQRLLTENPTLSNLYLLDTNIISELIKNPRGVIFSKIHDNGALRLDIIGSHFQILSQP
ncbi:MULTISPECIES: type II toxin-antitoxin system VapC family toxin [unclassified Anabaena]|uniref:type II toxin-antitoxin system VapC family toxin n=1 Tax=unclassified Anabaena TaxID=2619674 RepID=UPI0039C65D87